MSTDIELPPLLDSISSLSFHPTNPNLLLSGNWDRSVYLYNLSSPSPLISKQTTRSPILDIAWCPNSDSKAFVGGLSKEVRSVNFETNESSLITKHEEAVKCVEFSEDLNAIISASWDSTIRLTPFSSSNFNSNSTILNLPDKIYSLALSKTKIVVACGGRSVWIYDIRNLKEVMEKNVEGGEGGEKEVVVEPYQKRESSLKFMTRAVRCMPNDAGYATTSIEGRVAVEFFDPSSEVQAKKYAFKCHRLVIEGVDTVFPVQGLAFNPVWGNFATGGGDSTVSIWDPLAKKRTRQLPKYPSPISALEFNCDGTKLAVGFSEGDEGGIGNGGEGGGNGNGIFVRECGEEVRPKVKA